MVWVRIQSPNVRGWWRGVQSPKRKAKYLDSITILSFGDRICRGRASKVCVFSTKNSRLLRPRQFIEQEKGYNFEKRDFQGDFQCSSFVKRGFHIHFCIIFCSRSFAEKIGPNALKHSPAYSRYETNALKKCLEGWVWKIFTSRGPKITKTN